jgi:hypothetical protein
MGALARQPQRMRSALPPRCPSDECPLRSVRISSRQYAVGIGGATRSAPTRS